MVELFPAGFEEVEVGGELEFAAYTDEQGVQPLRGAFREAVTAVPVESGWEDAWRDFHRPVRVGPLWIGPPWEDAPANSTALLIDPGRAFGTGAHATTRLCLEFLLEEAPTSLVDIGCGSGVIAIAGARLGFSPAFAVDFDSVAVSVTRTNATVNGAEVEVRELDATSDRVPAAVVAVANIGRLELEQVAPRLQAERLVTSGYCTGDRPQLETWQHLRERRSEGWAADLYEPL